MEKITPIKEAQLQEPFEEFWLAFPRPRRVGKALCLVKWKAITGEGLITKTLDRDSGTYVELELKAKPREIIDGTKNYAQSMKKKSVGSTWEYEDDGRFICLPATFLNQGRWLDWQ